MLSQQKKMFVALSLIILPKNKIFIKKINFWYVKVKNYEKKLFILQTRQIIGEVPLNYNKTICKRILKTSYLRQKLTSCDVIFLQITSKIKNQSLNCKTTDLKEDANTFFKDYVWLFIGGEFSKIRFL